jgi:hypothetical protein
MRRLRAWVARILTGLGTYSVLAGLGLIPLPAALGALVAGAVAGQLALALGIAMIVSLVTNVVLVAALMRRRPVRRRRPDRPSALENPTELDSLKTTSADVDELWERPIRPPLWRSDDSWLDLVRRAWLRERPSDAHCVLYQGIDGNTRFWRVNFAQYLTSDDRLIPSRQYTLDTDGQLQAHRPWRT